MLKPSLFDYSNTYMLVKGTIIAVGAGDTNTRVQANRTNKQAILKNCAPFNDCITKTNKVQVDNAKYLDVVMLMYDIVEYSYNYSKTSRSLYQICRDIPKNPIADSELFEFKLEFLSNTNNASIINAKMPLKYLSNVWRTPEMPLINFEINLALVQSANCVTSEGNRQIIFPITDTEHYVSVVTLSSQHNTKLVQQLQSGLKYTISWNKYQSQVTKKDKKRTNESQNLCNY